MKIALCLYGQPRLYEKGYETIRRHILDKYEHVDVFYHGWWHEDECNKNFKVSAWVPRSGHHIKIQPTTEQDLEKLYQPVDYCLEKQKQFDIVKNYESNKSEILPQNLFSQMYSRWKVCDLKRQHEAKMNQQYDLVINTRFDINIKKFDVDLNPNQIQVPYGTHPVVFSDNFYVCNSEVHNQICELFFNIDRLFDEGTHFNPEHMIKAQIQHCNQLKNVYRHPHIRYDLFRN